MMKHTIRKSVGVLSMAIGLVYGQGAPAPIQTKKILLLNGKAHIGNGEVINLSAIGFEKGKITMVKDALTNTINKKDFDTVIDIKGMHVYPGFIAPNTTLGLVEIEAVRASDDQFEVGQFNPHVRSVIAYNTDSRVTPTVRTNGVLVGQIVPRGNVITGMSSIVHFDAWNWEDAIYRKDDGVHLNWPAVIEQSGWWAEPGASSQNKDYVGKVTAIEQFFKEAVAYHTQSNRSELDLRMEGMRGVLNGSQTLYVHASLYRELSDVISFKKQFKLSKLVIVGGYDSWMIAERLKENNVSVILQRIHSLPSRTEDDVDLPYKLPRLLFEKGVLFCLENSGDMEQMGVRNLPFYGGTAVAYGLPYEQAVAALTLNAAKIVGVDKQLGSLEVGKDATLFVSSGDALDMKTNNVSLAFIQGRNIDLRNHQQDNYEKYKGKFGLK
jgi:imidazolonepropionase-like amidohydrolase